MAKDGNNGGRIKNWLYILMGTIVLAGMFASGVLAWGNLGNKIDNVAVGAVDLKVDGCKPSTRNTLDIALVQKDISTIQRDIKQIRTEQVAGFKEILSRLPE